MSYEKWAKSVIGKQPVFESKDEAIKAAIQGNKKPKAVFEVWKEPKSQGGRYVVASSEAFEVLYREGYKRVMNDCELADLERSENIDEIQEI